MKRNKLSVLHLIIARGGSKGVKDKNIRELGGLPLVAFRAAAAKQSNHCHRLIVSTDSEKIANCAEKYGVEVPFLRPDHLASDEASANDVIIHAMDFLETNGETFDAIQLHEPSSPFCEAEHLNKALALMELHDAQTIVSLSEIKNPASFVGRMGKDGNINDVLPDSIGKDTRRQSGDKLYTPSGHVYLFRWELMRETKSTYGDPANSFGFAMDEMYDVEIDNPTDMAFAEFLVERNLIDPNRWLRAYYQ